MEEVRRGYRHWTTTHRDWTPDEGGADGWDPEVASYGYAGDALVLFDPVASPWNAIDPLVEQLGPPHVLLTIFWHVRNTPSVLARYSRERGRGAPRRRLSPTRSPSAIPAGDAEARTR